MDKKKDKLMKLRSYLDKGSEASDVVDPTKLELNKKRMMIAEKRLQSKKERESRNTPEALAEERQWIERLKKDYTDRNMSPEEQDKYRDRKQKRDLANYLSSKK